MLSNFSNLVRKTEQSSHGFFLYLQVKSGTLFDNIIITDDAALAKTFAEETWAKHKDVCCPLTCIYHVVV